MNTTHYAGETNPLTDKMRETFHHNPETLDYVEWTDPDLKTICRLRLVTDPEFPFWDVSYCYGYLKDGTPVLVQLPFSQLPKRGKGMRGTIIEYAKRDGVYAKGLGIFDNISTLI